MGVRIFRRTQIPVCFMPVTPFFSAPSATRADESNSKLPRFRRACEIGSFLSLPNWVWLVVVRHWSLMEPGPQKKTWKSSGDVIPAMDGTHHISWCLKPPTQPWLFWRCPLQPASWTNQWFVARSFISFLMFVTSVELVGTSRSSFH